MTNGTVAVHAEAAKLFERWLTGSGAADVGVFDRNACRADDAGKADRDGVNEGWGAKRQTVRYQSKRI